MELYGIVRRNGWATPDDLKTAAAAHPRWATSPTRGCAGSAATSSPRRAVSWARSASTRPTVPRRSGRMPGRRAAGRRGRADRRHGHPPARPCARCRLRRPPRLSTWTCGARSSVVRPNVRLSQAIERVRRGTGGLLLLAGDAGIGKTRLAGEGSHGLVVARLARRGEQLRRGAVCAAGSRAARVPALAPEGLAGCGVLQPHLALLLPSSASRPPATEPRSSRRSAAPSRRWRPKARSS